MMPKTKEFFFEHRLTKKIKFRFRMVKISILTIIVEHILSVFFTKTFVQCNKKNQSIIIHLHNI